MSSVAPHRRFVSVELPFCLPVTTTTTTSGSTPPDGAEEGRNISGMREKDRRMVEAFVPPSFLWPSLDEVSPTVGEGTNVKDALENPQENSAAAEKKQYEHTTGIASVSEYYTGEVFSGWRPLDFEACGAEEENEVTTTTTGTNKDKSSNSTSSPGVSRTVTAEDGKRERERMLRESFPSFTPQVLLQGFYRNDVLLEVTRTRRVKRLRDPVSGRVVKETFLEETEAPTPSRVTVVGVVSREVDIARPADFCFAPFEKSTMATAPTLCSSNLFPPAHFVAEKTPFEVEYEIRAQFEEKSSKPREGDGESRGNKKDENEPVEWEFEAMPNLTVMASDTNIPPPMLPAQKDLLARLNRGNNEEDCVELQTMKALLEERPVWIAQDLLDAILHSGVCPRTHINKKAMSCLTYVIKNGPFNRLRIRLGFDPYASYTTASLQRIAIKINRRSELGTLLRDISRVPIIADVMKEVEKRHAEKHQETENADETTRLDFLICRPRSSFFEQLIKVIQDGRLYVTLQIVDVSDDPFLRDLLLKVPATYNMPIEQRSGRSGWLGETGCNRATAYIAQAISDLIKQEVAPVLEGRGKDDGSIKIAEMPRRERSRSSTPSAAESDADNDEEDDELNDDASSFDSVASVAVSSIDQDSR